jgi:hypothetical protein
MIFNCAVLFFYCVRVYYPKTAAAPCTPGSDTQKKPRYSLSLSSTLRIVEVRSAAIFLSAQAQFRSQLPAD